MRLRINREIEELIHEAIRAGAEAGRYRSDEDMSSYARHAIGRLLAEDLPHLDLDRPYFQLKGRLWLTTCPKGHAMTPDNRKKNGKYIICRTCSNASAVAYERRKRQEAGSIAQK